MIYGVKIMNNKRFGIKDVADVTFYELDEHGRPGSPVIFFDTLKTSNIEQTAEQADAKGGKGNASLITWDHSKEINVALQDAVLSEKTLEMMYGKGGDGVITISANAFPGCYYVEGMTYARDMKTGKDKILKLFIPKAKIMSENTITMEAEGDPTVFDMKLRVVRGTNGEMMRLAMEATEADGLHFQALRDDRGYEVGSDTFALRDLIIPSSYNGKRVSQIGYFGETVLETVTIPDTVIRITQAAFAECRNLTLINLPSTLEVIEPYTFADCSSLRSITIPKNVEDIDASAFEGCQALEEIKVDKNNKAYMDIDGVLFAMNGANALREALKYPASKVGHYSLPESVNTIGPSCFEGARRLSSISLPTTQAILIDEHAFKDCTNLTAMNISHRACTIKRQAFVNCSSLHAVAIPEGAQVSSKAFSECDNLRYIYISAPTDSIAGSPWNTDAEVHWGVEIDSEGMVYTQPEEDAGVYHLVGGVSAEKHLVLPNTYNNKPITKICESAFCENPTLVSVDIPSNITIIDGWAFESATNLASVKLSEGLEEIGYRAFANSGLTSINIPSTVTTIRNTPFWRALKLKGIYVDENNPNFCDVDGVLFDKGKTLLDEFPPGKHEHFIIPYGVEQISDTFTSNPAQCSLEIPSTCQVTPQKFYQSSIVSVTFQKGVKNIGSQAFARCGKLKDIYIHAPRNSIEGAPWGAPSATVHWQEDIDNAN